MFAGATFLPHHPELIAFYLFAVYLRFQGDLVGVTYYAFGLHALHPHHEVSNSQDEASMSKTHLVD